MGTTASRGGHLPINGLNLYHEVYGELDGPKPPLLLIPGAFMAADAAELLRALGVERADVMGYSQGGGWRCSSRYVTRRWCTTWSRCRFVGGVGALGADDQCSANQRFLIPPACSAKTQPGPTASAWRDLRTRSTAS